MNQTWENEKNPSFGSDFGQFDPNCRGTFTDWTEHFKLRTYQPFSRQANFENHSGKLGGFGR